MNTINSIVPKAKLYSEVETKDLAICFLLAIFLGENLLLLIFTLGLILAR